MERVPWKEAIKRVEGICPNGLEDMHLVDWAAANVVTGIARIAVLNGHHQKDFPIPAAAWSAVKNGRDGSIDYDSGSLSASYCQGVDDFLAGKKSQLTASLIELELAEGEVWPALIEAPPPAPPGKGGAKRDQAAWDSFWMAVVDIAVQERLTIKYFPSQVELRAEILDTIGDALADRTIKESVRQIWHKWVDPK